jgi:RNA polymerase sigma-70 factor (ECF subfamily)
VSKPALKQKGHLRVVASAEEPSQVLASDAELIDAFERGDLAVAEQLYDRLQRVVNATLTKVLGERGQDHDDLVQSAFEQILGTLAEKKFARACSLASWAVAVTTNLALTTIRKRQNERRRIAPVSEIPDTRSSYPGADRRALLASLRTELARLAPATAEVVVLHEVFGHDLAEIAVLTGLSLSAAQSRLFRGRKELRERLESRFPGEIR